MEKKGTQTIMNNDFQKLINSLSGDEKEKFLSFLKKQADAGKSAEDSLGKYAEMKGYKVTQEQLQSMVSMTSMSEEDLKEVSAGSAFPVGTPDQNARWNCPTSHKNAYKIGREEERDCCFFWSQHMKEYHYPDCGYDFWVHED